MVYCVGILLRWILCPFKLRGWLGLVTGGSVEVVVIGGATLPGPTAPVGIFCNNWGDFCKILLLKISENFNNCYPSTKIYKY